MWCVLCINGPYHHILSCSIYGSLVGYLLDGGIEIARGGARNSTTGVASKHIYPVL